MKILVVDGAGYIGSHMVAHLRHAGRWIVVADNFSNGFFSALAYAATMELVEIDIADPVSLANLFAADDFDAVMHPARLVADSLLARTTLGWSPQYTELTTVIRHAWAWEQK